tara:strand:- start:881 stop:1132 length:252 start_codon:yes stop_codon:yes gene_type:complete
MEIEGLERKKADNPYNYTEEQQQEKLIALKTMKDIYPDVNPYYAEIIYDLCKNSSQEEIDKMKERIDTIPPKQEDLTKKNILI